MACSDETSEPSSLEPDSVIVSPATASISVGDTLRLEARLIDINGVPFSGLTARYTSEDGTIASVTPDGLVTGVTAGSTNVLASVDTLHGATAITVTATSSILLSTTVVQFTGLVGAADPASQNITVSNGGQGDLGSVSVGGITYGAGEPIGWLNTSLSSGTITLNAQLGSLTDGTYSASFPVRSTRASNSPQTVEVTLVVTS